MLWLFVILMVGGLMFVLFHKPHVNSMGVGWIPPEQRQLPKPPTATPQAAEATDTPEAGDPASAPQLPGTFNFDPLAAPTRARTDQPHA